jgi:hypothetical protein
VVKSGAAAANSSSATHLAPIAANSHGRTASPRLVFVRTVDSKINKSYLYAVGDPREAFQIYFYRALARAGGTRRYALKGGACLRFHYGSPRISEDIDFDIDEAVSTDDLASWVDRILESQALRIALVPAGIASLDIQPRSSRKQTPTTQRWKVGLRLGSGIVVSSKVEFSRRGGPLTQAVSGPPRPPVLSAHGVETFVGRYYDGATMAALKVKALAAPSRVAVRDLFDLHFLWSQGGVSTDVLGASCHAATLRAAADKVYTHTRARFVAEVAPFLSSEIAADLAGRWDDIQLATAEALERASAPCRAR